MTTKTRRDLILEALDDLGILVPGQAPSAAVMNKMDGIVDAVIEELDGLDIYYVSDAGEIGPSGGEIESSAFLSVAAYLANAAAAKFNLPADAKLKALAIEAVDRLERLARPTPTKKFLSTDAGIPTGARRIRNFDTLS